MVGCLFKLGFSWEIGSNWLDTGSCPDVHNRAATRSKSIRNGILLHLQVQRAGFHAHGLRNSRILRPSRQSDAAAGEPEYAQLRDLFIGRSNMVSIRDLSERINPHGIASKIAGGGSVIDLVMAIEGCNVATALQRLKIRAGDTMSP